MSLNLEKLHERIQKFSKDRNWDQFHSMKNLSMALSVEASELAEIFQWMSEKDSNEISKDPEKLQAFKDEIADVLIYLLRMSYKADLDLEEVVMMKMDKNELKYPVEKAFGNSKKYDQY